MLARQGAARELLAELLPFEETSPDSIGVSPSPGSTVHRGRFAHPGSDHFSRRPASRPGNADAYAGMGELRWSLAIFERRSADLATAARLRPDDVQIADGLSMADSVIALDPTVGEIGVSEQYARSRALLTRTIAAVDSVRRRANWPSPTRFAQCFRRASRFLGSRPMPKPWCKLRATSGEHDRRHARRPLATACCA